MKCEVTNSVTDDTHHYDKRKPTVTTPDKIASVNKLFSSAPNTLVRKAA